MKSSPDLLISGFIGTAPSFVMGFATTILEFAVSCSIPLNPTVITALPAIGTSDLTVHFNVCGDFLLRSAIFTLLVPSIMVNPLGSASSAAPSFADFPPAFETSQESVKGLPVSASGVETFKGEIFGDGEGLPRSRLLSAPG